MLLQILKLKKLTLSGGGLGLNQCMIKLNFWQGLKLKYSLWELFMLLQGYSWTSLFWCQGNGVCFVNIKVSKYGSSN